MDALTRKSGMSMDEACQILNVTKEADIAKLAKVISNKILVGFFQSDADQFLEL